MTEQNRKIALAVALVVIGGLLYFLTDTQTGVSKEAEIKPADEASLVKKAMYPRAKEITDPAGFINTDGKPIKISDFIGKKVILVDFWTYSCINCIRVQPYLNAWQEKYGDKGLLIVGIHTPEFEFEKNYDNVADAVKREGITYPVVLDSNHGTWAAYQNSYWPRKYLIDIDGYIAYDHIGEGGYDDTEHRIQELLGERAERLGDTVPVPTGLATPKDVKNVNDGKPRTPEIYFGASRNGSYLGNGTASAVGSQTFTLPSDMAPDQFYLGGTWNITPEYAESQESGIPIVLKYRAKDVYMVASSPNVTRIQVLVDGKLIKRGDAMAGSDIGSDDFVTVKEERLYKIIENAEYGEHTLELQISNGPIDAFTFTFG